MFEKEAEERARKLAEEWIKEHSGLIGSYKFVKYDYDSLKQAFLAGLKAGKDTNVPTKWHDLRKDPNDLPKRNNELIDRSDVIITDKGIAHYNFRKQKWYVHNVECDMSFSEVVIAWCDIPKYTKE